MCPGVVAGIAADGELTRRFDIGDRGDGYKSLTSGYIIQFRLHHNVHILRLANFSHLVNSLESSVSLDVTYSTGLY